LTLPIDNALAMANLTLKEIHAVELLGGGVRMPGVKAALETYFKAGDLELGQHLNGDEAMALGATFRGANISTAFRVRKVRRSASLPRSFLMLLAPPFSVGWDA
jgi:hypoxia up-regulated 1